MLSKRLAILSIIRYNLNAGQMALLDSGDTGIQEGDGWRVKAVAAYAPKSRKRRRVAVRMSAIHFGIKKTEPFARKGSVFVANGA